MVTITQFILNGLPKILKNISYIYIEVIKNTETLTILLTGVISINIIYFVKNEFSYIMANVIF